MSKPFEVERHDYITGRMQTLISELERTLERVQVLLSDSMVRNRELSRELAETRSKLLVSETRLNQILEAMAASETRR